MSDTVLALNTMVRRTIGRMHARRILCRVNFHFIEWSDALRLTSKKDCYFSFQIGKCHCCGRIKQRWVGRAEEFSMPDGKLASRVPGDVEMGSIPLLFG